MKPEEHLEFIVDSFHNLGDIALSVDTPEGKALTLLCNAARGAYLMGDIVEMAKVVGDWCRDKYPDIRPELMPITRSVQ